MGSTVISLNIFGQNKIIENTRNPLTSDYQYSLGTKWINTVGDSEWTLVHTDLNIPNSALWKETTAVGSSSADYITTIEENYNYWDSSWVGCPLFDLGETLVTLWEIGMSNATGIDCQMKVISLTDGGVCNFNVTQVGEVADCEARVILNGNRQALQIRKPNDGINWKIVTKRMELGKPIESVGP